MTREQGAVRHHIELNGWWDWAIPDGPRERRLVPSSYRCVGQAIYERSLEIPAPGGQRVFLCFEGIAFEGQVRVNGADVGRMLPFVPYEYDITSLVVPGANTLQVEIKDILAPYGPLIGWECYAGLIRDVFLEMRSPAYVADYQWRTSFRGDYRLASCTLDAWIESDAQAAGAYAAELTLGHDGQAIHTEGKSVTLHEGSNALRFTFEVADPLLWSPETPQLYDLGITLSRGSEVVDCIGRPVGFREFDIRGHKFYLNGQEVILRGVCRHELWGEDQGHTHTPAQMEQDMRMIKELGANYVRLVHYPQHRYMVELADRLGLMISEEPLSWASDFGKEVIAESTLEDLRRLILRDRNAPSVIYWLAWNECQFQGDYLSRAASLAHKLDPTRPISAANHMPLPETREEFDRAGLDFYTFHPYGSFPDRVTRGYSIEQVLQALAAKPVVFTEWGGFFVQGNPALLEEFGRTFIRYCRQQPPQPTLAGFSFWEWADMPERVREPPACKEGMLLEGLVDADRNKRPLYDTMAAILARVQAPPPEAWMPRVETYPLVIGNYTGCVPLNLSPLIEDPQQEALWEKAKMCVLEERKPFLKTAVGPLVPEAISAIGGLATGIAAGRPLILTADSPRATIPVGMVAAGIAFLGQVSWCGGYPLSGNYGERVARYILVYEDGTQQQVMPRNGMEIAASSMIYLHSRINPLASKTQRVLALRMDADWKEAYQVNYLAVEADQDKRLQTIICELLEPSYVPLLYGVSIMR